MSQPGPHPADLPAPSNSATTPVVVALFVVALALRPQLSAIGPLVPGIVAEFGSSYAFVGLLTAIPVVCMALFALVGPSVAAWFGNRAGIALSVGLLVGSGIVRALAPGEVLVLLATVGIGVGTAVVAPILAMFVRDRLPLQMVGGTSTYAGGTIVGAAIGAAAAVPLATAFGGWRGAMLSLSLLSVLAVVVWLVVVRPTRRVHADGTSAPRVRRLELPRLPLRRPVVWAIGLLFGLQSCLYYGQSAWLASVYIERGWDAGHAAMLLSVVSLASLVAIVLAPAGARRGISRRAMLTAAAMSSLVGLTGIAIAPDGAFAWAAVLGAGLGMTFTLLLTLPTDISEHPRDVGGASALMLLIGYLLASVAPSVLGIARDATGDFGASVWLLVAVAALMVPLSWSLSPVRLRATRIAVDAGTVADATA